MLLIDYAAVSSDAFLVTVGVLAMAGEIVDRIKPCQLS